MRTEFCPICGSMLFNSKCSNKKCNTLQRKKNAKSHNRQKISIEDLNRMLELAETICPGLKLKLLRRIASKELCLKTIELKRKDFPQWETHLVIQGNNRYLMTDKLNIPYEDVQEYRVATKG